MALSHLSKITCLSIGLLFTAGCVNTPHVPDQPEVVTTKTEPVVATPTDVKSGEQRVRGERGERGERGQRGDRQRPDMAAVAAQLGVSEEALITAMRNAGGPPPDFNKVAAELGISSEALRAALPGRRIRGQRPQR